MDMSSINNANMINPAPGQIGQGKNLGQHDFLQLMIAQAKNLDLESKTNGDFLGQIAQFSINDGINKMQESIQELSASIQSNQALQATSLVGRKILVNSEALTLGVEGNAKAAVNLPVPVDSLIASIYSETGELIRKIPLGQHDTGFLNIEWDGLNQKNERMAAGKYTIHVNGIYSGQEVALKTMTAANVDSVNLGQRGEDIKLNVAGIGLVSLNDVKQITE